KFHQWGGFPGMGVDHISGLQSWIPSMIELAQPMESAKDAEALWKRLKALPERFRHQIENLEEGLAEGRVAALSPVERAIRQLEAMVATPPEKSPYAAALERLPEP